MDVDAARRQSLEGQVDDGTDNVTCETVVLADVGDVVVVHRPGSTHSQSQSGGGAAAAATADGDGPPGGSASVSVEPRSMLPSPLSSSRRTNPEDDARHEREMSELLASSHCDRYKLQQLCAAHGNRIPRSCRRRAWAVLLGVEGLLHVRDGLLDQALATTPEDLSNQRVVMADVDRTRQTLPLFRQARVKHSAVKILTFYCKRMSRIYRQGLNEILAPFLLLAAEEEEEGDEKKAKAEQEQQRHNGPPTRAPDGSSTGTGGGDGPLPAVAAPTAAEMEGIADEGGAFNMFYAFMARQLPNMFRDGFCCLQFLLRCLALLLRYHDPKLARFLEQHDVGQPVLYATSWLLTTFAHDLPLDTLMVLWDTYILEESPLLHVFVCLAWLEHFREQLLAAPTDSVHDVVASMRDTLRLLDAQQVLVILRRGRRLLAATPPSFRGYVARTAGFGTDRPDHPGPAQADVAWVETLPCATVTAPDAVAYLARSVAAARRRRQKKKQKQQQQQQQQQQQRELQEDLPRQQPGCSASPDAATAPMTRGGAESSTTAATQGSGASAAAAAASSKPPVTMTAAEARAVACKRLVSALNTAVIVDIRPEAAFVQRHVAGCSHLHPRFLERLEQQQEGAAGAANLAAGPYAQKLLQTLRVELAADRTRPVLVVGAGDGFHQHPATAAAGGGSGGGGGDGGRRGETSRGSAGGKGSGGAGERRSGHGGRGHGGDRHGGGGPESDRVQAGDDVDQKRLRQAVDFLTLGRIPNVCIVEGGFPALRVALERSAALQVLCADLAADNNSASSLSSSLPSFSSALPPPPRQSPARPAFAPPLSTADLFQTAGRLDATLVRVETALDSAAEAAAAAVGSAASALERKLTAGASEVRHGVSSVARSVTSSLSNFGAWLSTEWNDDGNGGGDGATPSSDNTDDDPGGGDNHNELRPPAAAAQSAAPLSPRPPPCR